MKMHNIEIQPFVDFLMGLKLPGKESRMRTRLCKVAMEKLSEIEEEKMIIVKKNGNLDESGEVKQIKNENEILIWDVRDREGFDNDYRELMLEEWILDNTEERKDMFVTVKDIVLNVDMAFKGQEALKYDRWCEIVEDSVSYD